MGRQRIEPQFITKPIQLLAACFVAVIILDGGFLTGARLIDSPVWVAPLLVIAAILYVPLIPGSVFFLLTKYRPALQEDMYYAESQIRKEELRRQVEEQLQSAGLTLQNLAGGLRLDDEKIPEDTRQNIAGLVDELKVAAGKARGEQSMYSEIDPDTSLVLAQSLMAEKKWLEAGMKFEEYAQVHPEDWEANFSRGIVFANARGGPETDLAAVRAYNDAIAFAPRTEIDPNMQARLFSYRAGILKRLLRLDEAEADLHIAKAYATRDYEIGDIKYNLAAVYALGGQREKLLEVIQDLQQSAPKELSNIRARLHDYFRPYANDHEFLKAISGER